MNCLVPLTWREDVLTNGAVSANLRVHKAKDRAEAALRALKVIQKDLGKLNLTLPGIPKLIAHYKWIKLVVQDKQSEGVSPFLFDRAMATDKEYHAFVLSQIDEYRSLFVEAENIARVLPERSPQDKMRYQHVLKSIIKQCGRWFLKWTQIQANPEQFRNRYVIEQKPSKEVVGYVDSGSQGSGILTCICDTGFIDITQSLFTNRVIYPRIEFMKELGVVEHATAVAAIAAQFAPRTSLYSIRGVTTAERMKIPAEVSVVNLSTSMLQRHQLNHIMGEKNRVLVWAIGNESLDVSRYKKFRTECNVLKDPKYAFRGLLVAALAVNGVTPAWYTNLPGEQFWKFTVYAPGTAEVILQPGSDQAVEGTSMAAPVVTALVATILSTYPTLTGEEAVEAVKEGAEPIVPGVGGIPYALASQEELNDPKYNSVRAMSRRIWGMGRINFAKALAVAGSKVRARMIQIPQPVLLPPATSSPSFHVNPAKRARDEAADESRDHLRRRLS